MSTDSRKPYGTEKCPRPTRTYHGRTYDSLLEAAKKSDLSKKTALITGGSAGIGLAIAKAFAGAGIKQLILTARRLPRLEEVRKLFQQNYPTVTVSVNAIPSEDHESMRHLVRNNGPIDIVILNAAAVNESKPINDLTVDDLTRNFQINTIGPFSLVQSVLSTNGSTPLTVINISSCLAHLPKLAPYQAAYSASKLAMINLTTAFAKLDNVRAFSIHPGSFWTETARISLGGMADQVWANYEEEDIMLPGHYCVWLCGEQADALNGKMIWPHWDLDELLADQEKIGREEVFTVGLLGADEYHG